MLCSWTLLFLITIIILCLYWVFLKKFSQPFFLCQVEHFVAVCPACEKLAVADSSVVFSKKVAAYWRGEGTVRFPYHPAAQKLRRKLFGIKDSQHRSLIPSTSLLNKLEDEPNDLNVNIQLLDFYLYHERLHEAYDRAFETKINFIPNLLWYQSCVQLCKSYKNKFPRLLDEEFYANYLIALDRNVALSIQDVKMPYKSIPEAVALLASFDEFLYEATTLKSPSRQFLRIIDHMRGQLYFFTALILCRKAKQQDLSWSEMIKSIAPLLLFSIAECFNLRKEQGRNKLGEILNDCIHVSVYRVQQAGYILSALGKMSPEHFNEKRCHISINWKHRVLEILYNTSNYRTVLKTSAFMVFDETSIAPEDLPDYSFDGVEEFLAVSETVYPSSIHHLVWIGVQYLLAHESSICDSVLPANFCVKFTRPLQFFLNSSSTFDENVSKIDLEAFLFACIYCAKAKFDHKMDMNKAQCSNILPADVSELLCSPEQDLWWDYINQTSIPGCDPEEVKLLIRKGIDSVRLTGHHVLPLQLLVLLGRTFADKAASESNSAQAAELNCRARLYWEAALLLLKSPNPTTRSSVTSESMFEYPGNVSLDVAAKLIFEGNRFIEMSTMKETKDVDSTSLERNSVQPSTATAVQPFYTTDETYLKAILEQNIMLVNKLKELSTMRAQQIDDASITPDNSNVDTMSASQQPVSHNSTQINSSTLLPPVPVLGLDKSSASTVEQGPIIDFKPTNSSSAEVQVKLGEEKKILFENRVKLYSSYLFNEEWKERGVGLLQILKFQTLGQVRISVLLENGRETCADHVLKENMVLTAKGDRGWIYQTPDFVIDEKVSCVKLCVKFQTYEIAQEFYTVFYKNKPREKDEALKSEQMATVSGQTSPTTTAGLSSLPSEDVRNTIAAFPPNISSSTATLTETQISDVDAEPVIPKLIKTGTLVIDDDTKTQSSSFSGFIWNDLSRSDGESKSFPFAPSSALSNGKSENIRAMSVEKFDFSPVKNSSSAFTNSNSGSVSSVFGTKLVETKLPEKPWNFTFSSTSKNSENSLKFSNFTFNAQPISSVEPKKESGLVGDETKTTCFSSSFGSESKLGPFGAKLKETKAFGKTQGFSFSSAFKNSDYRNYNFLSNAKPNLPANSKKETMVTKDENNTASSSDNQSTLGLPSATTSSTPAYVEDEKKSEKTVDFSCTSNSTDGSALKASNKFDSFTKVGTSLSDANFSQPSLEKNVQFFLWFTPNFSIKCRLFFN